MQQSDNDFSLVEGAVVNYLFRKEKEMEIQCPHCGKSFLIADINVPPETKSIPCFYCHKPIPIVVKRTSEDPTRNREGT
jgi:predicted Zn finger-like uncharacterized protein